MSRLRFATFFFFFSTVFSFEDAFSRNEVPKFTDKDVNVLFTDFWQWKLVNNPEFATRIGLNTYNDRVNEMSVNAFKRRASDIKMFLSKLEAIKKDIDLKGKDTLALNINLLESDLGQYLSGMKFHTYVWPLSIMEGPQSDPLNVLSLMKRDTVKDMHDIILRLRLYAKQLDEETTLLAEGIRLNQTMNRHAFEKIIPVLNKLGSGSVTSSPFFAYFLSKPLTISKREWKKVVMAARKVIATFLQPAYKRLANFMEKVYLPKSRPLVGLGSVPNGQAYYHALLRYHTTSQDLTPQQVHDVGLKEVERINKLMNGVKEKVKFEGTLAQFREHMRSSEEFGFKDENDMVNHYKGIRGKVEKLLPALFGVLPKTPFEIKPVPHDLAPSAPAAYYNEPSGEGRPGIFYINTYDAKKRRKFIAESLFLHEALPGHHLQISLKIEHGSSVLFRKYCGMDSPYYAAPATFSMNTAFVEGWGLYSEYLGEEMNMYKDPYVYFGRLSQEMLRSCRLVVDTGMHALGWTRQKAIDFMASNTADDLHDITAEIDRYISIPGQALAYKIGEMKLKQLRRMTEEKLGRLFNVRKFHDFLMLMGNIPLAVLEKQVEIFIKKELQK